MNMVIIVDGSSDGYTMPSLYLIFSMLHQCDLSVKVDFWIVNMPYSNLLNIPHLSEFQGCRRTTWMRYSWIVHKIKHMADKDKDKDNISAL